MTPISVLINHTYSQLYTSQRQYHLSVFLLHCININYTAARYPCLVFHYSKPEDRYAFVCQRFPLHQQHLLCYHHTKCDSQSENGTVPQTLCVVGQIDTALTFPLVEYPLHATVFPALSPAVALKQFNRNSTSITSIFSMNGRIFSGLIFIFESIKGQKCFECGNKWEHALTSTSPCNILIKMTHPQWTRAAEGMNMLSIEVSTMAAPNTLEIIRCISAFHIIMLN